ncbi:hypothetical protein RCG17_06695 [Neobacillus sp. PS3-12]|uniref:hypothetical protein n=1 Tax=Neobacillus sp. PS3-12 TaxID=3070677 RepID=UPI0027E1C467|nr:hypothetical protein [Neobacillus sp. PS3-12]WML54329.1 hypothetical protein RCG17_06695 [Neobacillus sp. PS3-12]
MGYLEKFAEEPKEQEQTTTITIRLPISLDTKFKAYCDSLNLSVSKAMRLMIEQELKDKEVTPTEEQVQKYNKSRFVLTKWKRDGMIPCPICNEFKSASNFNRHCKDAHDMISEEIFSNPIFVEIAERMLT